MGWVMYLFGSGLAFYLGLFMILAALGLFWRGASGWRAATLAMTARIGMFIIVLSAVPLSYWFYVCALTITAAWLWSERTKREWLGNYKTRLRLTTLVIWLVGALNELPYHFSPRLSQLKNPPIFVIGDSVTAGTGSEQKTWPDLLPSPLEVQSFARMGATASSALRDQCEHLPDEGGLIVIEIGGNDLLGDTPAARFESDLDKLLAHVQAPGRTIVMFELPLPPLCNEYGRIQRRLASLHNVKLIPKRIFIGVLASPTATLDSIHLTAAGHKQMASAVWKIVGPVYSP